MAAQLTSATQSAASTVRQAETALRDSLEATGPTVASLLATSPTLLSTTSVHQLAAVATSPTAITPLIAVDATLSLPTLNPADYAAVVTAVDELIGRIIQSFANNTLSAVATAYGNLLKGNVNGAFASLEGLIINPLVDYGKSDVTDKAAAAIARYIPLSPLANAVRAAPRIINTQGLRVRDVYVSARTSLVNAVQGVISSLGTLNPVAVASAVAAGIGNVLQTAVTNTFGQNGGFAIARDFVTSLVQAAFPDEATISSTVTATVAPTTRASSTTTSVQSATGITQSSPSISAASTHEKSTTTDGTSLARKSSTSTAGVAESSASAASKVSAKTATTDSTTVSSDAPAHHAADETTLDAETASTKTVDVTSGNKVQPKTTAGASATSSNTSVKEPAAASTANDSPTAAKTDPDGSAHKAASTSAGS
ncbi:hypothetical protein [Mycolicibacterium madagascariense]|uniref:hypothetical protein n=1 Tax=Mycolicibacterium madagascariense TaxID=212765 RepID=UPI0013D16355|nr:hypothetical protein [Mycolicibacterium madagascariense]MCV7011170.1 hypothetical protein [Mycolicibacterium madagascariense]